MAGELDLVPRGVEIEPIATAGYPTPAKRPAYSVLEKGSTWAALGIRSPHWRKALGETLELMANSGDQRSAV
jgi:dTDP-4-dehydrorhamnose reductase